MIKIWLTSESATTRSAGWEWCVLGIYADLSTRPGLLTNKHTPFARLDVDANLEANTSIPYVPEF